MSNNENIKDERVPSTCMLTDEQAELETISPENRDFLRQRADEYIQANMWTLAFNYYNKYFTLIKNCCNDTKLSSQINFTKVANRMMELYENVDDDEHVLKCLLQILNLFPENVIVLNLLAVFMFKKGEFNIARKYLEKTLLLPIRYLPAEKNLLHLKWHQVPRWHFRMLNDKIRNNAYYQAINKALNRFNYTKIFDIGAGCGLLTLITTQIDCNVNVVAFEENKTLATMANLLIEQNNIKERVKFYKENSTEFKDNIERGKLIVTEIFDIAVFGEHALSTLLHAIDKFIDDNNDDGDDDFRVIPTTARLYVTGIECERISSRYRYLHELNELNLKDICIRSIENDTYDGEYLKNHQYRFITTTKMFLEVDFNDEFQLLNLLTIDECIDSFELECIEDCYFDILIVWFDLHLDDDIMITTNPTKNDKNHVECWEQAIFNLKHPINLRKGDRLIIQPELRENQLDFKIINYELDNCKKCFLVNRETITLLNDDKFVNVMKTIINTFKNEKNLTIIDYYNFPLFGLLMCKYTDSNIYHIHNDTNDLELIEYLLKINQINSDRFVSLQYRYSYDYLNMLKKIDLVMSNLINIDGSWYRQTLSDELLLKYKPLILPKLVYVKAQLIHSTFIDFCNKVDDGNCFNFGIAPLINQYTGTEHPNLDNFDYTPLSNIVEFDVSDYSSNWDRLQQIIKITIDSNIVNAILIWYDIRFIENEDSFFTTFDSAHYNRTCIILKEPKTVVKDDKIQINLERDDTFMKIFLGD